MPTQVLSEQDLINRVRSAEPALRRAAVNAIIAARNSLGTLQQLSVLIEAGRIEAAVQVAARAGAIAVAEGSAAVYVQSGISTSAQLTSILNVTVVFDQVHDFAVAQIRANRLQLVRQWTANQRSIASAVLSDGVARGLNPIEQAIGLRASTGLTLRQHQAVDSYRTALERALPDRRFDSSISRALAADQPLTTAEVDRMVGRYRERAIKHRAETIARTEALRSVNAGNHDAYLEAVDSGSIRETDITRTWISARDSRVRPDHVAANGQKVVGFSMPFTVGGEPLMYPGDASASGSQTIRCRCAVTVRITE